MTPHARSRLRDRDALARRKVGRIVYYRMADDHVRRLLADAIVGVGEGAPLEAAG